jgi:hypothetical protein
MSKGDRWFAKRLLRTFLSGILIFPDPNEVLRRVPGATWRTLIPRCKRHISISATFFSLCDLTTENGCVEIDFPYRSSIQVSSCKC